MIHCCCVCVCEYSYLLSDAADRSIFEMLQRVVLRAYTTRRYLVLILYRCSVVYMYVCICMYLFIYIYILYILLPVMMVVVHVVHFCTSL